MAIGQRPRVGGQSTAPPLTLNTCDRASTGPSRSPPLRSSRCWTYGVASVGSGHVAGPRRWQDGKRVEAPVKDLPRLGSGGTGSLADHAGKVVVLNAWASWCAPCHREMPLLQSTHEKIASRGGLVLGIDMQEPPEKALEFLREKRITFPSLRDRDREYVRSLGVSGYPETFLIDREGRIVGRARGPVTRAWLDEHLDPLLEEPA